MVKDSEKQNPQEKNTPIISPGTIRLRSLLVGCVVIFIDSYWIIMAEKVLGGPFPTTLSIFANVVFILAVLVLINTLLARVARMLVGSQSHLFKWIGRQLSFSSGEMLLIYSMAAIGAALSGHDLVPNLVGMMGRPWHMATPENRWMETFVPYMPQWLSVTDQTTLKSLYEGGSSLFADGNWRFWVAPMLRWTTFIFALVFVMMCINTLVRKQWTDRERLTFPIVQLPVAMCEPDGAVWKNKLFWLGFIIAFSIGVLNGITQYYPNIPGIPVGFEGRNLTSGLTAKPWSALYGIPYSFYPFVIGLGFLLPLDLSFSSWFFYWMWKFQLVLSSAMGMDTVPDFPFQRHQMFGGYVAIIFMMVWTSRGYLKQVYLRIMGRESELDDSDEPVSYRTAVIGAVLGFVYLCWFLSSIGLAVHYAVIAFLIYFLLATAISRIRAELGPPVHDLHFSGPDYMMTSSMGLSQFSNKDLVGLSYFFWFNRAYRAHPMPIGIESMKMADVTKSSQKWFFWAIMLAVVVGVFSAFFTMLYLGYDLGFLSAKFAHDDGFAQEALENLQNWWQRPAEKSGPNIGANIAGVVGFGFAILLGAVRLQGISSPFHPIGFAISGSWQMGLVWAPIMIAWLIKLVILHFGGLKLYKKAVPLFLGLILGDMMIGCAWSLVGIISDRLGDPIPFYSFWGA